LLKANLSHLYTKPAPSVQTGTRQAARSLFPLTILIEAKKVAFRRGVWYRALNRLERSTVDLTLRYVDFIKSTQLAKVLTAIITKIKQATESTIDRLARTLGTPMAQKISCIAVSWGYYSASKWATDPGFARYLAVCTANPQRHIFGSN
jgi:hypothetical protein